MKHAYSPFFGSLNLIVASALVTLASSLSTKISKFNIFIQPHGTDVENTVPHVVAAWNAEADTNPQTLSFGFTDKVENADLIVLLCKEAISGNILRTKQKNLESIFNAPVKMATMFGSGHQDIPSIFGPTPIEMTQESSREMPEGLAELLKNATPLTEDQFRGMIEAAKPKRGRKPAAKKVSKPLPAFVKAAPSAKPKAAVAKKARKATTVAGVSLVKKAKRKSASM